MNKDLEAQHAAPPTTSLAWDGISVSITRKRSLLHPFQSKQDSKLLLSSLSGSVGPGEMLAIMGPSGAGKSTLLDVLSTRLQPSSGAVSTPILCHSVRSISSYVEQHDSLLGVLTVRETIWYSAALALPPGTPREMLDARTDSILSDLGLSSIANNRIGTPIQRGISGGQKRRVSIGCSLVTLPKVLFLDEPTSGLDTHTAYEVIKAVRRLASKNGMAVLATIHSPNWEIFSSFDKVCLLTRGRTAYQGPVGDVASYFGGLGWGCEGWTNPADHMVGLVNDDFASSSLEEEKEGVKVRKGDAEGFANEWERYASTRSASVPIRRSASSSSAPKHTESNQDEIHHTSKFHSEFRKTLLLTQRNFLNYSRNLLAYGVRLGMYLGMGILLATVWVHLKPVDTRINDRLSVHFFSVAFLGFMSVAGIPSFLEERSVLLREARNSLYSPLAFTLANTLSTTPLLFLCSLLFSSIAYFSIGLHPGPSHFFKFLAFLYLGVLTAEFQALLIASAIPIFVASLAVCAFLNGFWMCVQGYFIRAVNLPRFWYYWAHWIDYETFAFDVLVKNDFVGLVFQCQGSIEENTCNCAYPSSLVKEGICAVRGEDVLDALDLEGISMGVYAAVLVGILVVYRVLFWVVLRVQL